MYTFTGHDVLRKLIFFNEKLAVGDEIVQMTENKLGCQFEVLVPSRN